MTIDRAGWNMELTFESAVIADRVDPELLDALVEVDQLVYGDALGQIGSQYGTENAYLALHYGRKWGLIDAEDDEEGITVLTAGFQAAENPHVLREPLLEFLPSIGDLWSREGVYIACHNMIGHLRQSVLHPEEWINGRDIDGERMSAARRALPVAYRNLLDQEKMVDLLISTVNMSARFFFPDPELDVFEGSLVPVIGRLAEQHLEFLFDEEVIDEQTVDAAMDSLNDFLNLSNEAGVFLFQDELGFSPPEREYRHWLGLDTEETVGA